MARSFLGKAGWTLVALAALGSAGYAAGEPLSALIPRQEDVSLAQELAAQPVRVTQVVFAAAGETHNDTFPPLRLAGE